MSNGLIWLMIICMGLVTYLERGSFILFLGNRKFPARIEKSLRLVPPAVLAALVTPAFLFREDTIDFSLGNHRLIAGIVAALAAWWSKNVVATILVGMTSLWLLQYFSLFVG